MPHLASDPVPARRGRARPLTAAPVAVVTLILLLVACTSAQSAPPASQGGGPSTAPSAEESAAASIGAESAAPSEGGSAQEVPINGTSFGADEITVAVGETVTFTNHSSLPHTVTEGVDGNAADGARINEDLPAGASVEVTFEEAGDYQITCLFHSNMNMVVHVQ
ncbi:MAG TPA: plastocyanin/azurin family copper-binding protein [candidate division Zixibacteria bacterium]|nr:plastocyanin/azurin family copper-binding protein [candidate division Zixibacteria bacterium]